MLRFDLTAPTPRYVYLGRYLPESPPMELIIVDLCYIYNKITIQEPPYSIIQY